MFLFWMYTRSITFWIDIGGRKMKRFLRKKQAQKAKILYERFKNSDGIPRSVFEEMKPYIHFEEITKRDLIDEEYDRACLECDTIIKNCEERGMIFARGFTTNIPLNIYWEQKRDFIPLLEKGAVTEEDRYKLFKAWFFNYAVNVVWEEQIAVPYVTHKLLDEIQEKAPNMWEQLKAEGRAYYEKAGYFEAKHKKAEALRNKQEQIRSMSEEERDKVVAVIKDGRKINIVDSMSGGNKMKSSDILSSLDKAELEVIENGNNVYVRYKDAGVLEGDKIDRKYGLGRIHCLWGSGRDFESACDNYLAKIRGRTMIFNPHGSNRHEILIPK